MTDLALALALIVFGTWSILAYWAVTTRNDRLMWIVLELRNLNDLLEEGDDELFDPASDYWKKVPES